MAILGVARLGAGRLGAFRLGYVLGGVVRIYVNNVLRQADVRVAGVTITDELNHEPNNATFRVSDFVPVAGQSVQMLLGGLRAEDKVLGGHILKVTQGYQGKRARVVYDCQCIDVGWLLTRRTVIRKYTAQSATAIIQDLITRFAQGFTTVNVVAGLPVIDEITFTNDPLAEAITQVMERIGGFWFSDFDKDIHAFVADPAPAEPITQAVPRTMVNIQATVDLSPVATRIVAKGGGSKVPVIVAAGATTLPVEDQSWFSASGGVVEAGPQRIAYTGVNASVGLGSTTGGSLIAAVPGAPTGTVNATAGKLEGAYLYKVTNLIGTGESPASVASAVVNAGFIAPDALALQVIALAAAVQIPPGTVVRFRVSYVNASGEGPAGRASVAFTVTASGNVSIGSAGTPAIGIPTGPAGTTERKIYRSDNGGAYGLVLWLHDNTTTSSNSVNGVPGPPPPAAGSQVDVAFGVGPTGTTARRIYRTVAGGTVYKLVTQIANNTAITFLDNVADAALGDELLDHSTIPAVPGETQLSVYDLAMFPTAGWVLVDSQYLRYTGRSGSAGLGALPGILTGIPASGSGAILAPIEAGSAVVNAPYLAGVTGILYDLKENDDVRLVITVNDVAAQTAMAAYVGTGDGVHEMPIEGDHWSAVEATAQGQAALARRKDPYVTVTYDTRDPSPRSGKSVAITTTSPAISGTFKIQRVTYSRIGMGLPTTYPLKHVECAATRYSFEALLAQVARRKVAF